MMSETIMLVDDDKRCLELLTTHLKSFGWEVIPASNGRELLENVRRTRPSMIVLDMEMPEMNGFDVARSLKEDPNYRDIPVLAATGMLMPEARERCLAAGCNDYISKPFTLQELKEHIALLLSRSGPRAEQKPKADGGYPRAKARGRSYRPRKNS
jgi:two-component system cell cycle response regulator DivK